MQASVARVSGRKPSVFRWTRQAPDGADEEQPQVAHVLPCCHIAVSSWSGACFAGRPRAEAETSQDGERRARSLEPNVSEVPRPKEKQEFGEEEAPSEGFAGCFRALAPKWHPTVYRETYTVHPDGSTELQEPDEASVAVPVLQ